MNPAKIRFIFGIKGIFSLREEYLNRSISDKHLSFKSWFKLYQLYEKQNTNQIQKKIDHLKTFKYKSKSKPVLKERNPELMKISTQRLLNLFKHRYRGTYYEEEIEDYYGGDKNIWIGTTNQMYFKPSEVRNELNHREHIK